MNHTSRSRAKPSRVAADGRRYQQGTEGYLRSIIEGALTDPPTARLPRDVALDLVQQSFASSEDLKKATGLLGLTFTILFATSFTTALQRVYLRAWRRPPPVPADGVP